MRRLNRLSWLLVCFISALCATAYAQFAGGPPPGPSLTGFSPTQGAQGSTVNVTFTGKNFVNKGLSLQFIPAAGLTVQSLQMVSPMQISARVQIDAAAQPGARAVQLMDAGRNLPSQLPFVVTAAPPCGIPGAPPCPDGSRSKTAPPALREFSPVLGTQGSNVTVTFTGANFAGLVTATAQFTPAAGITVQSTKVVNGNQIQAQLAIDASAPPGPRAVSLVVGKTRLEAQNPFVVIESMKLLRVVPNEVAAGSEGIDLTLEGTSFVPATQVSFTRAGLPTEIQVVGLPRYVDSTELHVIVNVLPTALPGGRDINLETPSHQTVTGKGMLNVLPPPNSDAK